jgi:WD40 repeat protein
MTAVVWGSPVQEGTTSSWERPWTAVLLCGAAKDHTRPAAEIRDAHKRDTWTGGIDISADGRTVVTRGGDDTIKLWDTRKFKTSISTVDHPSTSSQYPTSNIKFSPNSTNIVTGSQSGHLYILNPATLKPELVTPITPRSPLITVLWHEKLNQIITGSANAETHVLYNPNISTRGAR